MTQEERNNLSINRILEAAIHEFGIRGYKKSSLNRMCREGDISKGKLYHYFSDKGSLFNACICKIYKEFTAFMEVYHPEPSITLEQNLHEYFHRRQQFLYEHPLYPRTLFAGLPWSSPPEDPSGEVERCLEQYSVCNKRILLEIFELYTDQLVTDLEMAAEVVRVSINRIQFDYGYPNWDPKNPSEELIAANLRRFDQLIHLLLHGALKKD